LVRQLLFNSNNILIGWYTNKCFWLARFKMNAIRR
jgi:hypothetical protein